MPLTNLGDIAQAMQRGDANLTYELVKKGTDESIDAQVLLDTMIQAMGDIGRKFRDGEIYVPEVLMAANAMNRGLEVIKPMFEKQGVKPVGRVIIGTVMGDMHDIGKNLVKMMLVGAGFEVIDLGIDVTPQAFAQAAVEKSADIIAISALLITTMPNLRAVVEALIEEGIREKVKVIVGGAPVTQKFADQIGADGYAPDAAAAADIALSYVK